MQRVMTYTKIVGSGTAEPMILWNGEVSREIERQKRQQEMQRKADKVMLDAMRGNRDQLRKPIEREMRISRRPSWLRRMAEDLVIGWCILFAWALEGKLVEDDAYAG